MDQKRASGILLHPTSLPSPDGIGDLGPEAYHFLNFLHETGCQLWQILPLGPTGYGDSPYQCFSAFAGNPLLISPLLLIDEGLLKMEDLSDRPIFPDQYVDFGPVIIWKNTLLNKTYTHFKNSKKKLIKKEFEDFCRSNSDWLNEYALFMAIKEYFDGVSWDQWPDDFRKRDVSCLQNFEKAYQELIENHKLRQFLFFRQWHRLKEYAHTKNIQVIGDVPFVIAYDSADVWANPDLFFLDEASLPKVVAGVPPDYFSITGQLWGNPLYNWQNHKKDNYSWWIKRLKGILELVDIVRLDHFRGFEANWEIPFGMPTAEIGRWVKGPGKDLLKAVKRELKELPIIAEDLGVITKQVVNLRDSFGLPGMRILQFAFSGDPEDPFLPHNYIPNCFAYTGTHDNDTSKGWYELAPEVERDFCRRYLTISGEDISWSLIRSCWQSVAAKVIAPLQDILSLGSESRMNTPGSSSGNWSWRFLPDQLNEFVKSRLFESNFVFGRLPVSTERESKGN